MRGSTAVGVLLCLAASGLEAQDAKLEAPPRLFVQASASTAGPYGESWYLTLTPDGRLWVEVFFSLNPEGSLVGNFFLDEERVQSIREAVVRTDFFSLPEEMSPPKVFLHMPDLRIEVELADRTHKVSLYSPDELEGEDKKRFMDVWNVLFESLPFKPSW